MAAASIELDERQARISLDGEMLRTVAYAHDTAGWAEARAALGGEQRITIVVPGGATLEVTLPALPRTVRALHAMLALAAPLPPRQLVWTSPRRAVDGVEVVITLVRREWLEPRLAAVRQGLGVAAPIVTDRDGVPFVIRPVGARMFWRLAIGAVLVGGAAAVGVWLASGIRPSEPNTPPPRAFTQAVRAPASSPAPVPTAQVLPPPPPRASGGSGLVLLGVAGRLPDDADVLVRTPWGKTTTMRAGDSLVGWKLVSIAADRVVLENAGRRDELVLEPSP